MMKQVSLSLFAVVALFSSCQKATVEEQIAAYLIPFEQVDTASFEEIANRIGDCDLVILGESGHGDGTTYEVKAELVQYLMKEKGFNTLALEGEGFIQMEIKNNGYPDLFPHADVSKWKPHWGNVVQTTGLVRDMLHNQHLNWKYIGIEGYDHHVPVHDFLYAELEKGKLDTKTKNQFIETYKKMIQYDEKGITVEEVDFILETMTFIIENVQDQTKNGFIKQALVNIKGGLEDYKYTGILGGYENENKYVNIRDKRMAENVIWYKKNNPEAKIIVWIANFHGAKQAQNVRYRENDPDLYQRFKLFAEYLVDAFDTKVYSIAFISSSGEAKEIHENSTLRQIYTPENALEYYLHQRNTPFGYLDFNEVKAKEPTLK
ncbi:erythromycin esterase family protein [Myroides fluvii]|uniref:erythromycin esterase family protein n=1 Tax=Myroides fluvii TaxID=2572594 RepID=UPI001E2B10B1|nr:erythromycin esterase family protein [Myroides fluvii]